MDCIAPEVRRSAEMFLARLTAETAERPFSVADVGLEWGGECVVLVDRDEDMGVTATDTIEAALMLLWTLTGQYCRDTGVAPAEIVRQMAYGLARQPSRS